MSDLSGWPVDSRERCDFYHRIRIFPDDVAEWRKRLAMRMAKEWHRFPGLSEHMPIATARSKLDDGISYLREIARVLALVHGTPRLGNKEDAVDELVYIILARKTREDAYQRTFNALKARFPSWDDLVGARRRTVERLVHSGGLSGKKTDSLFGALRKLRDTFGSCTLEPTRDWSDEKLEEFLCSLPEISRKSAYCIMMYSYGRKVFPVDTHVGRVLSRLGPYRELGLSLQGLDHKQLQAVLADLIPPNLRYSLHVNLVVHGRQICRSWRPLCAGCELKNFCSLYRKDQVKSIEQSDSPIAVDLFAGSGGLSEGLQRAGFRVILALDQDPLALRTYRLNHPSVPDQGVICLDIRELRPKELRKLLGGRRIDLLAGAPPCQGFSHAGFRSKTTLTGYRIGGDDRNFLFEDMVAVALELRPRMFLMENVPGMHSERKDNLSFLELAAQMLEQRGDFRTVIWRMNASAHGVPQARVRYFLVASTTEDLPSRPSEEYQDVRHQDFDVDALPPVTLDEAIFDLPRRDAGDGCAMERWDPPEVSSDPRYRRYLAKFGIVGSSQVLYNHTVRYHNERDLELYGLMRPGEDSIHVLERHQRADLMRYRRDVFDDKYARLRGDRPSKTIVAHLAKDGNGYVHPSQIRSISIREAARLQSFPDTYAFCGSPSDQWIQIGNAVPPLLAEVLARSLMRLLRKGQRK